MNPRRVNVVAVRGNQSNPRITTKIPTDRKLDVVAKVSDNRKSIAINVKLHELSIG